MNVLFLDIDGVLNCQLLYEETLRKAKLTPQYWLKKFYYHAYKLYKGKSYYTAATKTTEKEHALWKTFEFRVDRLRKSTCPKRLKWLDGLCLRCNIKVVISSTWRHDHTVENWTRAFRCLGCNNINVIGVTDYHGRLRGEEINRWLLQNGGVTNYVIIDDDSDMLPWQRNHFFQTDPYSGLTPTTCYKIERFLSGEK